MGIDGETRGRRVSGGAHGSARTFMSAGVAAIALACGSSPPPAAGAKPAAAQGVARYLPLEHDTVYSYETHMEPGGDRGLLILEIRRHRPELAELVVAGRAQRLNVSATSVELVKGGGLLGEPLSLGDLGGGGFGRVGGDE